MVATDIHQLLQFFKALANESRLKLVGILAQRECSVEELAVLLNLKEPTISHHLSKLKSLSLVKMRSEGNTHLYRLDNEALHHLNKAVFSTDLSGFPEVQSNAWEAAVLKNFLDGDRLKEIPASRKKRWVILKWLVDRFQPERPYPEAEINTTIQQHHPDSATLRRELIGYGFMERENGIYRRLPESAWKSAG